jgi:hypothetical protein
MKPFLLGALSLISCIIAVPLNAQTSLVEQLTKSQFKIAYESYVNDNWEIFVSDADGSHPVNITHTAKEHEHYPQISPDGSRMCFTVDHGEGRDAIRTLYVMNIDGTKRRKLLDYAREPFWSPDGKVIGFLPQEFPKFNVIDYYTKGMNFYDLKTGKIEAHPNSTNLFHLYNPSFAPDGKWIISTVHAGMGFDHAILAIERYGTNIINLKIPGCRPCVSPDGKQLAWGAGDHEVVAAPLQFGSGSVSVGAWRLRIKDHTNELYHVDWSPDSRFLSLSRGPASRGDPTKTGTFLAACEIVGVYAPGWDLCAVSAEKTGVLDLGDPANHDFTMLTTNGLSNKESAWFRPRGKAKK